MFGIFRKRVVVTLATAVVLGGIGFSFWNSAKEVNASIDAYAEQKPKVLLDAGHGGFDGGAVSGDVMEKDLNLAISKKIAQQLRERGITVVESRDEDVDLAEDSSGGSQKKRDMQNRAKLIVENPDAIFLSIHMNKFSDSRCKGAQVFYGRKNEESKRLAELLQTGIVSELQPENHRLAKQAESSIYLLKQATIPAVIVECGFLSNAEDLKNLQSETYQSELASVIADCIEQFYRTGEGKESV